MKAHIETRMELDALYKCEPINRKHFIESVYCTFGILFGERNPW